jgi:uncharacterized protein (DUF736 family)
MQYDDTNKGAIFKNDRKQNERQPDYNGTINVEGKEYYISCWIKESKAGKKFFSTSLTAKEQPQQPTPQAAAPQFDNDEDLPF